MPSSGAGRGETAARSWPLRLRDRVCSGAWGQGVGGGPDCQPPPAAAGRRPRCCSGMHHASGIPRRSAAVATPHGRPSVPQSSSTFPEEMILPTCQLVALPTPWVRRLAVLRTAYLVSSAAGAGLPRLRSQDHPASASVARIRHGIPIHQPNILYAMIRAMSISKRVAPASWVSRAVRRPLDPSGARWAGRAPDPTREHGELEGPSYPRLASCRDSPTP